MLALDKERIAVSGLIFPSGAFALLVIGIAASILAAVVFTGD